jgi:hypothetical protein
MLFLFADLDTTKCDADKESSHADVTCPFQAADLIQKTQRHNEMYSTCLPIHAVATAVKAIY